MSIDTEFAVRRDIRNNPVLREVDSRHRGELHRYMLLVAIGVALFLFSAWQRESVNQYRKQIVVLEQSEADEQVLNRKFRLTFETFSAQPMIERKAFELGLRPPLLSETLVIERAPARAPAPGVVAHAR